jgi:hypothetical protein
MTGYLSSESVDAVTSDRFIARGTLGSIESIEIGLAVRSAVSFKEISCAEGFETLSADEVISVPFLAQRSDASV